MNGLDLFNLGIFYRSIFIGVSEVRIARGNELWTFIFIYLFIHFYRPLSQFFSPKTLSQIFMRNTTKFIKRKGYILWFFVVVKYPYNFGMHSRVSSFYISKNKEYKYSM